MIFLKDTFKNIKKSLAMILPVILLVGFTSCDNNDEEDVIEPESVAYVSLYNASPNNPGLDIVVDNRIINTYSFDYTESTGYLRFYTGDRTLRFSPFDANNVTLDTTTTFEQGKSYSVFVAGEYPELSALITNDNTEEPDIGNAKIRVVHLSPDAGTVNLKVEGSTSPVFEGQEFKDYTEFTNVEAASYDFMVTNEDGSETILEIPDVTFADGLYYTIVVRGYDNPPVGNDNFLSAEILVN